MEREEIGKVTVRNLRTGELVRATVVRKGQSRGEENRSEHPFSEIKVPPEIHSDDKLK